MILEIQTELKDDEPSRAVYAYIKKQSDGLQCLLASSDSGLGIIQDALRLYETRIRFTDTKRTEGEHLTYTRPLPGFWGNHGE